MVSDSSNLVAGRNQSFSVQKVRNMMRQINFLDVNPIAKARMEPIFCNNQIYRAMIPLCIDGISSISIHFWCKWSCMLDVQQRNQALFCQWSKFCSCGSYCIHNFEIVSLRQVILLGFQDICKWKMAVFGTEQVLANKQSANLNMVLCPVSVITLYIFIKAWSNRGSNAQPLHWMVCEVWPLPVWSTIKAFLLLVMQYELMTCDTYIANSLSCLRWSDHQTVSWRNIGL